MFPSARGRPLSEVAIPKMVRNLEIAAVPHGFRSSFRDWAAECSDAPREVCELALAHVNTNSIEAAYRRTDMFERRRALMEQWAAFLTGAAGRPRRRRRGAAPALRPLPHRPPQDGEGPETAHRRPGGHSARAGGAFPPRGESTQSPRQQLKERGSRERRPNEGPFPDGPSMAR